MGWGLRMFYSRWWISPERRYISLKGYHVSIWHSWPSHWSSPKDKPALGEVWHWDLVLCPDDFPGHLNVGAGKDLPVRVYMQIRSYRTQSPAKLVPQLWALWPQWRLKDSACLSSMSRRELWLLEHSGLKHIPSLAGAVVPSEDRTNNPLEPFPEIHFSRSQEEIQVIHFELINNRHIPVRDMGESIWGRVGALGSLS